MPFSPKALLISARQQQITFSMYSITVKDSSIAFGGNFWLIGYAAESHCPSRGLTKQQCQVFTSEDIA